MDTSLDNNLKGIIIIDTNPVIFCNVRICDSTLANVEITQSNIGNTRIKNSNISNSTLSDIIIRGNLDVSSALINLSNASYSNTNITNSNISNSILSNVVLRGNIDASGANLNLGNAFFNNVAITNSNISNSILSNVVLRGNIDASGANLNLGNAFFNNVAITYSNISNSILSNVVLRGNVDIGSANINLSNTSLSNVQIINSNLINSNISNINVSGNIDFKSAKINNFSNANISQSNIEVSRIGNSYIFDSLLSNVRISDTIINPTVDYTNTNYNGRYSKVIAAGAINAYQSCEICLSNSGLRVKATDPSTSNSFFGIAQESARVGTSVLLLNEGVTIVEIRRTINLPVLIRQPNGQCLIARDAQGRVITQSTVIPVFVNDLLVLAGTNSDILAGPLTNYYVYNATGNDGLCTVYKTITINSSNCGYIINVADQNSVLSQKQIKGGRFIQVLGFTSDNKVIGLLM